MHAHLEAELKAVPGGCAACALQMKTTELCHLGKTGNPSLGCFHNGSCGKCPLSKEEVNEHSGFQYVPFFHKVVLCSKISRGCR